MNERKPYSPGPATGAQVRKEGEQWALILVRDLRHAPEKVWKALTEPEHLSQWSPFDSSGSLAGTGNSVKLTTVGAPSLHVTESTVTHAEAPKLLQFNWGTSEVRWELEAIEGGTRLTLWTTIDRNFISMGAAGWHICLDVLGALLEGSPLGRIVGADALKFGGWQKLNAEYAEQFGVKAPQW